MTDRAQDLINLVIDGEATRAERAELETRLADSPELRNSLEQFQQVALDLERAALIEPPPTLKSDILSRIRTIPQSRTPTVLRYARGAPPRVRRFAFAAALAAGVILAVILHPGLRDGAGLGRIDSHEVSGAMTAVESQGWNLTQRLVTDDQQLSVLVRQRDELVRLEPSLINGDRLTVRWNPEALTLIAANGRNGGRSLALVECTAASCEPLMFRFRRQNRSARVDLMDEDNRKLGFLLELE